MERQLAFINISDLSFFLTSLLAIIIGVYFFWKEVKARGLVVGPLLVGSAISVVVGVVTGGVMVVVMTQQNSYDGGFSLFVGIIVGLVTGYGYLRQKQENSWKLLDIVAPFLILALGISRIGSDIYGIPISKDAFWTIKVNGETLHPVQAYEFIFSYLLFGYLWLRLKSKLYDGQVILNLVFGFLVMKIGIQFFIDQPLIWSYFSLSQLIFFISLLGTIMFMKYKATKGPLLKQKNVEKYDIAKTWFYIWVLMFLSLIFYYIIQS